VAGIDGDGVGGARTIGRLALAMLEAPGRCQLLGGKRLSLQRLRNGRRYRRHAVLL
jgi:hypothetical protein